MAEQYRTAYAYCVPYCVRVPATGNGQEKEKKGKDDINNNEKTVVLQVFSILVEIEFFKSVENPLFLQTFLKINKIEISKNLIKPVVFC